MKVVFFTSNIYFVLSVLAMSFLSLVLKFTSPLLTFSSDYLLPLQTPPLPISPFLFSLPLQPCCLDSIILCCLAASPY